MRAWLDHAAEALRFVGDRPDMWLPGALAALAYLGWVPLLATVASLPDAGDLGFFAIGLWRAPPRIAALIVSLVTGFGLLTLLAAFSEAAIDRAAGRARAPESLSAATLTRFAVILVASLPAVAAAGALALGIAAVAPGEYQSPSSIPVVLRVLLAIWPLLVVLLGAVLVGQAVGAVAMRRATGPNSEPVLVALQNAAADLIRQPIRRLATATVGTVGDLLMLVLALALLRVLWAPIDLELQLGRLANPETLLLLVGFVAIWLALTLAAGALRAAVAIWWSLELGAERPAVEIGAAAAGQAIHTFDAEDPRGQDR